MAGIVVNSNFLLLSKFIWGKPTKKCFESFHKSYTQTVTNKPKKKDSDMKIDKTTYKDRKERQIGKAANHICQSDKVLFFADPHFLFFKSQPTFGTLSFARHTSQCFTKAKEPNLPHIISNYFVV